MKRSLVLLATLAASALACAYGNMDARCTYTEQPDWSYMMFTLTWPGVFCADGCCRSPQGVRVPSDFTIHGLWPNYAGNSYPACCQTEFSNENLTDLISSDASLRRNLNTYWPALKKCHFVQYEFDKHGSCATASTYSGDNGLRDYLEAALYLRQKWDLLSALRNAGITPGSTPYNPSVVLSALQRYTGTRVRLHCDRANPRALSEVRLCVKKMDSGSPLAGTALACSFGSMDARCSYTEQSDWSYMMFTVSWPGVFCADGCCRNPQGAHVASDFTIHGLWPNYAGNSYPSCCQTEFSDDDLTNLINSDASLRRDLNTYWPALKKCHFVQYEFDKHGSCATASTYSGDNGLRDYLEAALYLRQKWDLLSALGDAGIRPGNTKYKPTAVLAALQRYTGTRVRLHCDRANPRALSEVRLCVKKMDSGSRAKPELIDCPALSNDAEGCAKAGITLPKVPAITASGCAI
eukprot:m51a1_g4836 hypothetical protein (465) ;mRNA; r:212539-214979